MRVSFPHRFVYSGAMPALRRPAKTDIRGFANPCLKLVFDFTPNFPNFIDVL
jgi:hypothetical protein